MKAAWLISLISGNHAELYLKCTNSKDWGTHLEPGGPLVIPNVEISLLTGEMGFWLSSGDQIQPFLQGTSSAGRAEPCPGHLPPRGCRA